MDYSSDSPPNPRIISEGYQSHLILTVPRKLVKSFCCCGGRKRLDRIRDHIEYGLREALIRLFYDRYFPVERLLEEVQDERISNDLRYIREMSPKLCRKNQENVTMFDVTKIWRILGFNSDLLLDDELDGILRESSQISFVLDGSEEEQLAMISHYNGMNVLKVPLRYISTTLEFIILLTCPRIH